MKVSTGELPFGAIQNDAFIWLALRDLRRPELTDEMKVEIDDYVLDVMQRCWAHEPSERPSAVVLVADMLV